MPFCRLHVRPCFASDCKTRTSACRQAGTGSQECLCYQDLLQMNLFTIPEGCYVRGNLKLGGRKETCPSRRGERQVAVRSFDYQIWQRMAEPRIMASPSWQSKAFANSGKFEGPAIARKRARGCVFVFTMSRSNSGRSLAAQICE